MAAPIRIGVAGWSIPAVQAGAFPDGPSHLARYAATLGAVEINSSFYRPHKPATYARWAQSTPDGFRFAVKMPRTITHERRLVDIEEPLDRFLGEIAALGGRLGPVLVQMPPSLRFEPVAAGAFWAVLRGRFVGDVVCEPRHASWFDAGAEALLERWMIARVAADPAPAAGAGEPGGWRGLAYHRLHGAPRIYHSPYSIEALDDMARRLAAHRDAGIPAWCVFDNTALGHAPADALALRLRLTT